MLDLVGALVYLRLIDEMIDVLRVDMNDRLLASVILGDGVDGC